MAFGLGSMIPALKPVSDWVDPRRTALMGFSAGAFSGDMSKAMQYAMQGSAADRQYAAEKQAQAQAEAERNATAEWVKQNAPQFATLPPALAFEAAMKEMARAKGAAGDALMSVGGHIYDTNTGQWISPPETADNRQNVSLTPQWGQDAQGNWVMLQPSSTGELVQSAVPEGIKLVNPFDLNAQKAGGTTFGKQVGDAQFDMPAMEKELEQSIDSIKKLSEGDITKGKDEWFGQVGALPRGMWLQGGTNMAKFKVAADNVIDRSWLSARAMLKGGGPITDYESNKAENAVSMMKGALEKGDKKSYDDAVIEYEYWIRQGFAKLQQQAGAMPGYGGGTPASAAPAGGGWKVVGVE